MNSYEKVIQLSKTTSTNEKELFLKDNKDDYWFKGMLKWLLDDSITTGMSSKKLSKDVSTIPHIKLDTTIETMEYIKCNNTGKDSDIRAIQGFINKYDDNEKYQTFLEGLFTKEFKCGISAKTYNKVFKDDKIYVFDIMLAKKYEDHIAKVKGEEFTITKKLDGNRVAIIKENGMVSAFTRSGKPMLGLNEIFKEFEKADIDNTMFDGELLAINTENMKSDDLFRKTMKLCRTKEENKTGLEFYVFDIIPLKDFRSGVSEILFRNRKDALAYTINKMDGNFIKLVEDLYVGRDTDKIVELLEVAITNGDEGVMVNLNAPYLCKRTHNILKVKRMGTYDLRVVDVFEGEGKYKGMLGGITVELMVDSKAYKVGCGSGFKDEDRVAIWGDKSLVLDKIVEVQHFGITKNQKGGYGLRFPVFLQIREDKDTPSQY